MDAQSAYLPFGSTKDRDTGEAGEKFQSGFYWNRNEYLPVGSIAGIGDLGVGEVGEVGEVGKSGSREPGSRGVLTSRVRWG